MSLDLKAGETASKAIRRIGRKRIDKALKVLAAPRGDRVSDESVHLVRKRLKQARAILRIAREELGGKQFRRENRTLRNAGRPLSQVRDAKVMLDTLESLSNGTTRHRSPSGIARVRAALSMRREGIRRRILGDEREVHAIRRSLGKASRRVPQWKLKHRGWKALEPGLRRIYARGRAALTAANRDGSDEVLHQLRKRGKDLRYSLELLSRMEPTTIGPLARTAHRLTDSLGQDHDLAVLQGLLNGELRSYVSDRARQQLRAPVTSKRSRLQKAALEMAEHLYEETEDEFIKRMHGYWKAWRRSRREHQESST